GPNARPARPPGVNVPAMVVLYRLTKSASSLLLMNPLYSRPIRTKNDPSPPADVSSLPVLLKPPMVGAIGGWLWKRESKETWNPQGRSTDPEIFRLCLARSGP